MYLVGMQTADDRTVEEASKDAAAYVPYTADMIPQAGAWNAQLGEGLTELQSGISNGSVPVIVSDGTNTLMVWIVKDIARGVENAPYAVWSRYDSSTKTWSEPKAVDDNGNADSSPMLLAGKDGIRLAYLESGKVYADGESPELSELFSSLVFKTAKFDAEAGGFTDFRTAEINADGGETLDYVDIAAKYREYLIDDVNVPVKAKADSSSLYVDMYGGCEKQKNVLGFPVFMKTSMTSYNEMQDILELPGSCRMNTPGISTGNWRWRMLPGAADAALAERLRRCTETYRRL